MNISRYESAITWRKMKNRRPKARLSLPPRVQDSYFAMENAKRQVMKGTIISIASPKLYFDTFDRFFHRKNIAGKEKSNME